MAKQKSLGGFAFFVEETLKKLGFLIREFGFEHSDTSVVSYECSVTFRKDGRVAVTVFKDGPRLPWVMLVGRIGNRTVEAALDFVIEQRCPERKIDLPDDFPEGPEGIRRLLDIYAEALRDCARDFLEGDPSVIREVRPLVDKAHRRAVRELYGENRRPIAKKRQIRRKRKNS